MFTAKVRPFSASFSVPLRQFHQTGRLDARNIKAYPVGLEGEWRKARTKKFIKIELPDFEKMRRDDNLPPDEYISKMKEKGIAPPKKYKEKPVSLTCMQGVLDPYIPPEGDGKFSILSKDFKKGAGQKTTAVKAKASSVLALRKIKSYEDNFDAPTFAEDALRIYIKAHELLASHATEELFDYVTDYAYPLMTFQRENKTIRWKFIKTNTNPEVLQMRTQHLIEKENMFAQITVRFDTRQTLAIYDRFGHLINGSEAVVKDVLEYVVFEKNISDTNSRWRIHGKIIPEWAPKKEAIVKTFVRGPAPPAPTAEEEAAFNIESEQANKKAEEELKT